MILARRRLLHALAAGLAGAVASAASLFPAAAQAPNPQELMVAGPLGERSIGKADAPVTIVEYASMTCGHCASFHNTVYPTLKAKYIDTGKVRLVLREFPLDPLSAAAFMLARCSGEEKHFAMVDALFRSQRSWVSSPDPVNALLTIAKQAGFTQETFEQCLTNQELLDGVEWVRQRAAEKFGVTSTPTFFINGKIQRGAPSLDELEKILGPMLPS